MKTKPSRHFQVGYIHSRGRARGGRGHHWPKLGHPFGHPTQNCRFCPFFFLTRNTFIKMRNRRISLWPHKTGDFSDAHFSFASAPGAGQRAWKGTGTKWASVEQQWTAVWWDAVSTVYILGHPQTSVIKWKASCLRPKGFSHWTKRHRDSDWKASGLKKNNVRCQVSYN